jgi:TPR repeat protein
LVVGDGVPKNSAEAAKWYRLAAEQGNVSAQFDLGVLYLNGDGVPKNLLGAHAWWKVAQANGSEDAGKELKNIETQMTAEQLARPPNWPKAPSQNSSTSRRPASARQPRSHFP